jgi:hypothetical protein
MMAVTHGERRRLGRIEAWLFAAISAAGLLGFMNTLSTSDVHGVAGSDESRAAVYAQQKMEELNAQSSFPEPSTVSESVGNEEFTRTWSITHLPGTQAPGRLARIVVTVTWGGTDTPPQTYVLETLWAE